MRLWRDRGGDDDGPAADPQFLSRAQARLVQKLFRQAMAERGRELAVDDDGNLRDAQGSHYGLRNISVLCLDHPGGEKEWPQLIAGYADHILKGNSRAAREEVAALTPEQARGLVYLSIFRAASLGPGVAGYRSAPELAPACWNCWRWTCRITRFIHVLADETAASSLRMMASMARAAYGREQGRISPDVFWWRDGNWMPVPSVESGGKVTLHPGPELSFLLADLAARPPRG